MNPTFRDLSIDQRIRLVEDVWDSIAAEQQSLPLPKAQREELDKRLDALEVDGDMGRSATSVLASVRKKL
ncbi:addiction module protein [Marinobacterium aestuarii]|uniref:Addiction module protein n=1 Tax=Marinobacterium aestuarii TaxID=1821621 RepID=A0A1A9EUD8_9GAMM|nr:addiction module protein [Marinobacterium aestuarii]ANG61153.1 addiction module protein [Marinobacterium aestuarii]